MSTTFRPYHPDQSFLLPPNPRDWLPEKHLAYFISDTIDSLDLRPFYKPYEGDGRRKQPYEPAMMLKVLVYAYASGTYSSRKIARKIHEDIAFRVLAAGNFPAYRTISDFRKNHLSDFETVFVQLVRIAQELGLVKLGTLAIDGSKVKANASKHKAMSYDRMIAEEKRILGDIRILTKRAKKADAHEDEKYGMEGIGDDIPAEISRREDRLKKIQDAKARVEERQKKADRAKGRNDDDDQDSPGRGRPFKRRFGEPKGKAQDNFTDPESRIMKTSKGFEQCYNGQVAVDQEAQLIVATDVTQKASDVQEMKPLLDRVRKNTRQTPKRFLADAGYASEDNFKSLCRRGIDGYVSMGRGEKDPKKIPEGQHSLAMYRKVKTKRGKEQYRKRKWIVEPVYGWIKSVMGFRSFSLRGLENVQGEWSLVCLAANLRRLNGKMEWT
jgi:transposase